MKQENKAVNAGVNGFIAKPFNADELKIKINEALGIKQKKDDADIEESIPKETASGKVRLKIAHIQITDHLILGALKYLIKKGDVTPKYFELETQCMSGWNPVKQSLEKGTVDAACILAPIAMDINLRGKVIPVVDLRLKFGMEEIEYNDRSCIIILEFETNKKTINMGIAIDSVTEVLDIKASEIEDAPSFGINLDTGYILGMAKMEGGIKILLDMEYLLTG